MISTTRSQTRGTVGRHGPLWPHLAAGGRRAQEVATVETAPPAQPARKTLSALTGSVIIGLVVVADTLLHGLPISDAMRGAGTGAAILVAFMLVQQNKASAGRVLPLRAPLIQLFLFLSFVLTGIAIALAAARGNSLLFLIGDTYHWMIVGIICPIVFAYVFRYAYASFHKIIIDTQLVAFALASVIIALGIWGFPVGGGMEAMTPLGWRANFGFVLPLVPLIFVIGSFWAVEPEQRRRLLTLIVVLLGLFILLATFKRTMIILFIIVVPMLVLPRRLVAIAAPIAAIGLSMLVLAVLALVPLDELGITGALGHLDYNPNFSTDETLSTRLLQFSDTLEAIAANPLGHGFGALVEVFTPGARTVAEVHYIHNQYLFWIVQHGVFQALVFIGLLLVIALRVYRLAFREDDMRGMIALTSMMSIYVSGVLLLSFHSIHWAMTLGLWMALEDEAHARRLNLEDEEKKGAQERTGALTPRRPGRQGPLWERKPS